MRIVTAAILLVSLTGCGPGIPLVAKATSQGPASSVLATISIDRTRFDLAQGDEIDIHFSILNRTEAALPRTPLRNSTELKINGVVLPDSHFIFGNGPGPSDEFLPVGQEESFAYRMTSRFNRRGVYQVSWHGDAFDTSPVVFRVLTERKEQADDASEAARDP
jgi:hypothetical protein